MSRATQGKPMDPTEAAILAFSLFKKSALRFPLTPVYHFCVSIENQKKMELMKQLHETFQFKLEWCLKALNESEEIENAGDWLLSNAPE